jgi:hypothetical protein
MTVNTVPAGEVERRAAEMVLLRDAQQVSQAGHRKYGADWDAAVSRLDAAGLNSAQAIAPVMEIVGVDRTHEVMHRIAQDPEQAASLARMPPARRIAEISKIADAMNAPPRTSEPAEPAPPKLTPLQARYASKTASAESPPPEKPMGKYDDRLSDKEFDDQFFGTARQRDGLRKGK